jgi:hypothetical protein
MSKRGQSTILDRLYPTFNSRIELPVEIFFEPSDLLANIRRTSHVKPITDPALVDSRGASYRPGQTHYSQFTAATSLELLFAKFKLLETSSD